MKSGEKLARQKSIERLTEERSKYIGCIRYLCRYPRNSDLPILIKYELLSVNGAWSKFRDTATGIIVNEQSHPLGFGASNPFEAVLHRLAVKGMRLGGLLKYQEYHGMSITDEYKKLISLLREQEFTDWSESE